MDMPNIPIPGAPMSLGTTGGVSDSLRELARRLEQDKTQAMGAVILVPIAGQLMMVWTGPKSDEPDRAEVEIMRLVMLAGESIATRKPELISRVLAEQAAAAVMRSVRGDDEGGA